VLIVRRRQQLGLSLRQAISLCLVALVCLPCSGNLGRAAALQRRWVVQASELRDLGFADSETAVSGARLVEMLTRARRLCAEDSAEYRCLTAQLRQLEVEQ
jgi:hypothetical protein